ncbi:MAG TPA: MFS transporter [Planctomycetota bacterium]|nr:MFS transporter [Planctomycetota bacterium]
MGGSEVTEAGDDLGRRTLQKVIWRLIPFIFLCYIVAYIDRVNTSFAAKSLQLDLHLTKVEYGRGAGLFFLGYFLFEIPSNMILRRVGARIWIARIMIVWGIVSMGMIFVKGVWSFYIVRVILGLSEAGFFPGMVLYLTYWIPARDRARAGALFMMAAPVAMAVGGPLSGALLEMNGHLGLKGWHWLFLIEGVPAVILGFLTLRFLTDSPEKADWLRPEERTWLLNEMDAERARKASQMTSSVATTLSNPKVWLLCLIYCLNSSVTYGIFLWLPQILEELTGYKGFKLGLINSLPFIAAIVGMIVIGAHSDKSGERKYHVAFCSALAAIGLGLAAVFSHQPVLFLLSFALCQVGQRSVMSVFWAIPPIFLGGAAAAAGIALINAIGNVGGYFGPDMMGYLAKRTGGYAGGLGVLAGAMVLISILVSSLRLPKERVA